MSDHCPICGQSGIDGDYCGRIACELALIDREIARERRERLTRLLAARAARRSAGAAVVRQGER